MASIQGVYIALFGRPADPSGLAYFNDVTSNGGNLSAIGDLAGQKEYTDRFTGMSNITVINSIYQSLFNRDAEPAGLEFFAAALTKGALNINSIAIAILDGAQGTDKSIIANKLLAADMFTKSIDTVLEQADYSGKTAADAGRAFLAPIGAAAGTIPSQSATDTAIAAIHDANNVGKLDIVLTAGDDIVSPTAEAAFKTTNADDTIHATNLTFGSNDKIDGGFGNDSLILKTTGIIDIAPQLTGIEKIFVTATGTGSTTTAPENSHTANVSLDLDNATGYKEVWNDSSMQGEPSGAGTDTGYASVAFTNIALGTTLGLAGTISKAPTDFIFKDASGTSDSATLVLNAAHDNGHFAIPDIENLTINVKSASNLDHLDATSAKTVMITGDGDFALSHIALSANATIDGSAHTGNLMVSNLSNDLTAKGGAGNDSFIVFDGTAGGIKITGGAGSDFLQLWDTRNISDTSNAGILKDVNIFTDFDGASDTAQVGGLGTKFVLTNTQLANISNAATIGDVLKVVSDASIATMNGVTDTYATFIYKGDTYIYHDLDHNGLGVGDGLVQLVGFTGELNSANFIPGDSN